MNTDSLISSTPQGIYLITPDNTNTDHLIEQVQPLLNAGIVWLQYRNKMANQYLAYQQAQALLLLCQAAGVPLIINDNIKLALAIGADGVHLGEDDGAIAEARLLLGQQAIIGASCYNSLHRAQQAVAAGASYIAFGAFFPSQSKTNTRTATPDLLRQSAVFNVPRVAIGGIHPEHAGMLRQAGADLLAVISGVFSATNPLMALKAYQQGFATEIKK